MKYTDFLKWVDIDKYAIACHNICNQKILNEPSNRFMKEKFILGAMQLCNHEKNIDWMDLQDYDLRFKSWRKGRIEVKTGNNPMFSTTSGKPKKTVTLKLKSVHGSVQQRDDLDKDFDHLMIIQIDSFFSIGFVDYDTVVKKLKPVTDGFLVNLSHDDIDLICKKDVRLKDHDLNINMDPKDWVMSKLIESGL
jgi:hypothetical protein